VALKVTAHLNSLGGAAVNWQPYLGGYGRRADLHIWQ
jgi:hypothetical protein